MSTDDTTDPTGTDPTSYEVRHGVLGAGPSRSAVFTRTYDAPVADVWDACTTAERLRRWYAPVEGDLRVGGTFTQGDFGVGTVTRCEAPHLLTVELGGGSPATDQIELRLREVDGGTVLELEHATTLDTHEIGGQVYDAVYCMGGGYGPRLQTLQEHLDGTLSPDLDPSTLHTLEAYGPPIQRAMAQLDQLLTADASRA